MERDVYKRQVLTSLGSVLAMAWVLKLERAHAVSFLPKSVTTAIGMDVRCV